MIICLSVEIHEPTADMFENIMRFCQMLVQAIDLPYQPLRQIPHINQGMARFLVVKKVMTWLHIVCYCTHVYMYRSSIYTSTIQVQ